MIVSFPRIIIVVGLALQLSCANINVKIKQTEAARDPLSCALYAAQVEDNPEAIVQVAIKYAEARDFVRAIELVESVPERGHIELRYRELYFRRVQEWNVTSKLKALAEIAVLQAKDGKKLPAAETLEKALALAQLLRLSSDWSRSYHLQFVIPTFVLIGQEDRALRLIHNLLMEYPDDDEFPLRSKIIILAAIALNLHKIGNDQRSLQTLIQAERLMESSLPTSFYGDERSKIADVYAQLGNLEKAINLIKTNAVIEKEKAEKNPGPKPDSLRECAEKLVKFGKVTEGINLADAINDPQTRAWAISNIAQLLAQSKNYELAFSLLKKSPVGEARFLYEAQEKIAKLLLDEGNFGKAFEIVHQIENANRKASVLAYAAQLYIALGNPAKARETAISAYEFGKQDLHDNGFPESAVQYILLVEKNVVLEKLKEEGAKRGSGWALEDIAEKLSEANLDTLAIEVLKYIQAEDYVDDAGPITIQHYRAGAIGKIALHYYDSKRPVDTKLQATLAEFVRLLD